MFVLTFAKRNIEKFALVFVKFLLSSKIYFLLEDADKFFEQPLIVPRRGRKELKDCFKFESFLVKKDSKINTKK